MRNSHPNYRRITLCLAALLLTGASIAAAALPRVAPAPIATEHIGGTTLSITPQIAYENATLRIAGPDGYALTQRFPAGTPISADLLSEAEPKPLLQQAEGDESNASLALPTALPDGLYHYEVVFTDSAGARRVHTGIFYARGGGLQSRESKQTALSAIRSELATASGKIVAAGEVPASAIELEFLSILDNNGNDDTFLALENECGASCIHFWQVAYRSGLFQITRQVGLNLYPHLTMLTNGDVGLGTTAPQGDLQVVDGYPEIRLEDTDDATWQIDGADDFDISRAGASSAFTIEDNNDFVGIQEINPAAPLHVVRPSSSATSIAAIIEDGTLQVVRNDAITPNIRFLKTNGTDQSWLFQNNANSGVFAIRDETGGNSVLRLRPGAPENGLTINANGSFTTSTGATLTAGGVWQNASSRTLKQEITNLPLKAALAALADLRAVTFAYKKTPGVSHVGFIAEEVPALVATASRKTLSTMEIVGVLTRVLQEQQTQLAQRDAQIAQLSQRLAVLEAQMAE